MNIPTRLLGLLNENEIRYTTLHHPERFTAQELAQVEGIKGREHAKVVMTRCDDVHQMVVLPSDRMLDLGKLNEATGKEWEIESEEEFKELFPDCELGAMPPIGRLYDLETLVDRSLATNESIVFEAGTHTDAIKMQYRDYEMLAHPDMGDFSIKAGQ
jgi:Ala-tRNA(Pro) deacylase